MHGILLFCSAALGEDAPSKAPASIDNAVLGPIIMPCAQRETHIAISRSALAKFLANTDLIMQASACYLRAWAACTLRADSHAATT